MKRQADGGSDHATRGSADGNKPSRSTPSNIPEPLISKFDPSARRHPEAQEVSNGVRSGALQISSPGNASGGALDFFGRRIFPRAPVGEISPSCAADFRKRCCPIRLWPSWKSRDQTSQTQRSQFDSASGHLNRAQSDHRELRWFLRSSAAGMTSSPFSRISALRLSESEPSRCEKECFSAGKKCRNGAGSAAASLSSAGKR